MTRSESSLAVRLDQLIFARQQEWQGLIGHNKLELRNLIYEEIIMALSEAERRGGEVALRRCMELLDEHVGDLRLMSGGASMNPEPLNLLQLMGRAYIQGIRDVIKSHGLEGHDQCDKQS